MGCRLKSLSEDKVDAYTHIWSVALFLFMALLLLLIPNNQDKIQPNPPPEFDAICWCPAYFDSSQIVYTNARCSEALNFLIQNKSFSDAVILNPSPPLSRPFWTTLDRFTPINIILRENDNNQRTSGDDKLPSPVVLFILAVALRLPRILWSILSRCCNSVNIGRTLASAEKGDSMDIDCRRQMYSGLVSSFKQCPSTNKKTATCLYFLMKILMIIVIVAEIMYVIPLAVSEKENNATPAEPEEINKLVYLENDHKIRFCRLKVRGKERIVEYTPQCFFKQRIHKSPKISVNSSMVISRESLDTSVFFAVLVHLAIVLFVNAINTMLLFVSLAQESTRVELGLEKDSPLDLVLLMQMARTNLSVGTAVGLAKSASGRDDESHPEKLLGIL